MRGALAKMGAPSGEGLVCITFLFWQLWTSDINSQHEGKHPQTNVKANLEANTKANRLTSSQ